MGIVFTQGFNVNFPTPTMRSLLSAAGQATYDAATVGNFFSCSLADYNAVFAGYTDAQKIGNTDVQFNTQGGAWSGTCAGVLPAANSTIPSNTYIVGFACRMQSNSNYTVTPLISTTYQGTYTAISNSPTMTGTSPARFYFLRKDPAITSATSYVGHVASANFLETSTTSYTNGGFDCSAPYSTWSSRTGTFPNFQMFVTTTKPY